MENNFNILKKSCYLANIAMAIVGNISPILFITFRNLYGISYSLLGLLVVINFVTQLFVDLTFSFFSHKLNIPKVVKFSPLITILGMIIFAFVPVMAPSYAYGGLVFGTVIFSAACGFNEVLTSPIIASIPSDDPDKEMSKHHSAYAWGSVGVILFGTLFLTVFGEENWYILMLILALEPLYSFILFQKAEIPNMHSGEKTSGAITLLKNPVMWVSILAIFLGGAAECTMAQWSSGYIEKALQIPKVWGDVFGVALFGVMLGLGRSLYGKYGKNITKVLIWGAVGATGCYLIAAISKVAWIGLFACAFTGFCTSMLWPGNLVVASERIPKGGVFLFAMMASGGDLGASVGPQIVGVITDFAIANPKIIALAEKLALSPEQLGMKLGMLFGMLFPLAAIFVFCHIHKKSTS